jgi:2'-5' RNA ligase
MQGVVSLLDMPHQDQIAALHAEIERTTGVPGLCQIPVPHFSYHVADEYDPDMLAATLLSFAASNPGFRVRTSGFGVFTGSHTVVYIPIVRGPILTAVHHVLWRQLSRACRGASEHYHPDNWLPHITLIDNPALAAHLPDVMRRLARQDLHWELEITNVALLYGQGEALGIRFRHPLRPSFEGNL